MKKLILTAALCSLSSAGMAADLPLRAPPTVFVTPPIFTWTGVYIGGQIGYGWGRNGIANPAFGDYTSSSPEGVLGGAHVGYNYQINQFVFGLEGDLDGTNISRSVSSPTSTITYGSRIPVEGSVRGRIGLAWDRALLYATGGAAFADFQNDVAGPGLYYSDSSGRVGWTVGGGVEYEITNNWSVRGEYRYSDFGQQTTSIAPVGVAVGNHVTEHAVRVGFSYKFDMRAPPMPVVAKY